VLREQGEILDQIGPAGVEVADYAKLAH
jgi:hypothetical protein